MKLRSKNVMVIALVFGFVLTTFASLFAWDQDAKKEYEEQMKKWRADSVALAQKKADALEKNKDAVVKKAYNSGNSYYKKGQYEQALVSYGEAISGDAGYSRAYFGSGNALKKLRRYEEAEKAYKKAISLDKKMKDIIFH